MTREVVVSPQRTPARNTRESNPAPQRSEPVSSSKRPRRPRNAFLAPETKPPNSPKDDFVPRETAKDRSFSSQAVDKSWFPEILLINHKSVEWLVGRAGLGTCNQTVMSGRL